MTVSVQTPYNESVANGVTTVFPFTFKLLLLSDLRVFFNGVEQLSGFTVSGIGVNSGGNVTFTTPPANLVTVLLKRELVLKRDIDYQENGDLPANGLDNDIDRVWQAIQQFGQLLKASIKLPFTTSTEQIINDSAAVRANTLLGFDGFGNVVLKLLANLATTPISVFFSGLLNLNDAIALRAATGTNPDIYTATTTGTASAYLTAFSPTLTDFSNNPTFKITFDKACADNATIQIAGITPPLNLKYKTSIGAYINVAAGDILANHTTLGLLINNNTDLLIQTALSAVPTPLSTITANTTLTKSNAIGQNIRFITNNSLVATLPAANTLQNGGVIQFTAATFNNSITRAGADNIFLPIEIGIEVTLPVGKKMLSAPARVIELLKVADVN